MDSGRDKIKDRLPVSLDSLLHLVLTLPYLRYKDIIVGVLALAAGLYLVFDLLFPLVEVPERGSYLQGLRRKNDQGTSERISSCVRLPLKRSQPILGTMTSGRKSALERSRLLAR